MKKVPRARMAQNNAVLGWLAISLEATVGGMACIIRVELFIGQVLISTWVKFTLKHHIKNWPDTSKIQTKLLSNISHIKRKDH